MNKINFLNKTVLYKKITYSLLLFIILVSYFLKNVFSMESEFETALSYSPDNMITCISDSSIYTNNMWTVETLSASFLSKAPESLRTPTPTQAIFLDIPDESIVQTEDTQSSCLKKLSFSIFLKAIKSFPYEKIAPKIPDLVGAYVEGATLTNPYPTKPFQFSNQVPEQILGGILHILQDSYLHMLSHHSAGHFIPKSWDTLIQKNGIVSKLASYLPWMKKMTFMKRNQIAYGRVLDGWLDYYVLHLLLPLVFGENRHVEEMYNTVFGFDTSHFSSASKNGLFLLEDILLNGLGAFVYSFFIGAGIHTVFHYLLHHLTWSTMIGSISTLVWPLYIPAFWGIGLLYGIKLWTAAEVLMLNTNFMRAMPIGPLGINFKNIGIRFTTGIRTFSPASLMCLIPYFSQNGIAICDEGEHH